MTINEIIKHRPSVKTLHKSPITVYFLTMLTTGESHISPPQNGTLKCTNLMPYLHLKTVEEINIECTE